MFNWQYSILFLVSILGSLLGMNNAGRTPTLFTGCYVFNKRVYERYVYDNFYRVIGRREDRKKLFIFMNEVLIFTKGKVVSLGSSQHCSICWTVHFEDMCGFIVKDQEMNRFIIEIWDFNKRELVDILAIEGINLEQGAPSFVFIDHTRLIIRTSNYFVIWHLQLRRCIQVINRCYKEICIAQNSSFLFCKSNEQFVDIYRIFHDTELIRLAPDQVSFLVRKNNERFFCIKKNEPIRIELPQSLLDLLISVDPAYSSRNIYSIKETGFRVADFEPLELLNNDSDDEHLAIKKGSNCSLSICTMM